jgi:hypothetical protein
MRHSRQPDRGTELDALAARRAAARLDVLSHDMTPHRKHPEQAGPPSVPTAPAQETGFELPPPDAVMALRIVGSGQPEIALAANKRTFLLGSDVDNPDVDVRVSSRMKEASAPEQVSRIHLLIQRKGSRLWIKDQESTNGTFINDRREHEGAAITAGETFRVGDVTLLAMDEQMAALRPKLQWALGFRAHAYVDKTLRMIFEDDPLLLIGEPACEQRWLGEQIHATSPRRQKGFAAIPAPLAHMAEQIAHLTLASHGTAFVDLAAFDRVPAPFVKELFGETYRVRPIIASPTLERATSHLGTEHAHSLRIIKLPPIRERRDDVPRILNSLFRRPPLEKRREVAELGERAVEILTAFDWPDNFDDLRRNAPKLLALIESGGSKRGAARLLGQSHQSVGQALGRIGL